jgi:hypothetical protein
MDLLQDIGDVRSNCCVNAQPKTRQNTIHVMMPVLLHGSLLFQVSLIRRRLVILSHYPFEPDIIV